MEDFDAEHIPLIAGLLDRLSVKDEPLDAQRRRQLLAEISAGGTTRKRLAASLGMRAATVTQHVGELLDVGLVQELYQIKTHGKGRPEVVLTCATTTVLTIVIRALSDQLYGSLIDLGGVVRREISRRVEASDIDAPAMQALIAEMARELRDAVGTSELAGLVVSVPGIVDENAGVWLFSSRFPRAAPLAVSSLAGQLGIDVWLQRALNAEMRAKLLQQMPAANETTVLLHWGYGIGLSYASGGVVHYSSQGAFGEVGHWRSAMAGDAQCRCGETGCLETRASLWSLVGPLGLASSAEDEFGRQLQADAALAAHPLVSLATDAMAMALRDVYLLLFPNRITITGPFVQSPQIYERLVQMFKDSLPPYMPGQVVTDVASLSFADEMIGAAKPLLHKAFQRRLEAI